MADNWQLKAVLSAVDKMSPVLKNVGNVARTTRKYLSDIAGAAGNLGGRMGLPTAALSSAMAGFSAVAIKNALVGLTDMEDELSKVSAATGLAAADIKRMQYVAKLGNVPFESLTMSMAKLNKQIGDAAVGKNKDLAGLFKQLQIPLRGSNHELRSAAELLPQLSDAFKRNENPVVRARMGMALFGKSWQEIMPMLADGSDKLNERMARFKSLGLDPGDNAAYRKKLDLISDFGDKLDDLSFVSKGFQNTIAAELIPVLNPVVESTIKWLAANKQLVATEVKAFVRDLANGLRNVDWAGVVEGAKDFAHALSKMVDFVGGAKYALAGLVLFMNAQAIIAFVELLGSVWRLVWGLGAMALSALAPIAPLQTLSAEMATTNARASLLLGTVGKLAAAAGVAGAAFAGWELGKWANENLINPAIQSLSGDKDATLGTWLYDKFHPEESAGPGGSVMAATPVKASGEIKVSFDNAPSGMRVEQAASTGSVPVNTSVGYRSFAMGLP